MTRPLLIALLLGVATVTPARAVVQLEPVVSGLASPVYVTHARDGSGRLFIVEQPGRVRVLQPGASTPTTFLDITARVLNPPDSEQGLLGLAFHPAYPTNGRFFVNYTRRTDGAIVIAEYRVSAANPNVANPTETVLLVIPHPNFSNHNGGMIEFGPDDGFLYIAVGDGGSGNDPDNRAQNIGELLGKILRIDVDLPGPSSPYSSSPSNPFVGPAPGRDEIFAVGFRNPWRFSFDRGTRQLFAGDVGQDAREEVDVVTVGGNYGWRVFEGTLCTGLGPAACGPGFIAPIAEYATHVGGRCAITGGYVYRGPAGTLPAGTYVFGDFCTGEIFTLQGGAPTVLLDTNLRISSFGEDQAGELYVVDLGGAVHRLRGLFTGGVFVAVGNVTGDANLEIVTGAGAGGGPHVRAFAADGTPTAVSFFAYHPQFTGGVRVAACDFDGDGRADILTGAGPGGGPHVRVFKLDVNGRPIADLASFHAYHPGFRGGVFVACGDVNGDGVPEIVTGAGEGGGPHVRVWSLAGNELSGFFAYHPAFTGGVRVAVGDVNGDGVGDIVTGAGPGGGPHVRAVTLAGGPLRELASFMAYHPAFTGGVFVAAGNLTGDARLEIVTGAGAGGGPHVRAFTGTGLDAGVSFFAYGPGFAGGVRVAAGALPGPESIVTGAGPGGGPHVRSFTSAGTGGPASFFAY